MVFQQMLAGLIRPEICRRRVVARQFGAAEIDLLSWFGRVKSRLRMWRGR